MTGRETPRNQTLTGATRSANDFGPGCGTVNLVALALLASLLSSEPVPWTLAVDEAGVRVEQRLDDSPVLGFRAESRLEVAPEVCLAIVSSDRFFQRTAPNVAEARVVATEGERRSWFYARLDPPFVAPRDYTIRVEESASPSPGGTVLRLAWTVDNARGPPLRPGTIRVEKSEGAWVFEPFDGGRSTLVRYELSADPGGSLPRWLARRIQVSGILAAFAELRRASGSPTPSGEE